MQLPGVGNEIKITLLDGAVLPGRIKRKPDFTGFVVLEDSGGGEFTLYVEH